MFSGADTEWFPTLGESWHVPQVPGITARFRTSFNPPTPVMLIGLELNTVWPRAMLARLEAPKNPPCPAKLQALKRLKITGVNVVPNGLLPSGSFMPTKKAGVVSSAKLDGPPAAPFPLKEPAA